MDPRVRIGAGWQASRRGLWLLLVLAMAGANAVLADVPAPVEVYTTADQPLATADAVGSVSVKVHELDGIQRPQAELSQSLPRQSAAALPIAQARIAAAKLLEPKVTVVQLPKRILHDEAELEMWLNEAGVLLRARRGDGPVIV